MKLIFFLMLFIFSNLLKAAQNHNPCETNSQCCTLPDFITDPTVPTAQRPPCDVFNELICIQYPQNGQQIFTDGCVIGCEVCACANGVACQQPVLKSLTVRGTTAKPKQVVVVTIANIKLQGSAIKSKSTVSQLAPGGYGKWELTFFNIPTGRLTTAGMALPTIITAFVCQNMTTTAIFIKKRKNCPNDCDLVCPPNLQAFTEF